MAPSVEPISESEGAELSELFGSAGPYVSARTLSDYWLYARLFSSTCLCVHQRGQLAAALIAFRDQTPGVEEIYIQDVAVADDFRKQGLAQQLLTELHRRARGWGTTRIWLTSEVENHGAMALWQTLGYVNPEADYLDEGVWLTKNLKGPGRDRAIFEIRF